MNSSRIVYYLLQILLATTRWNWVLNLYGRILKCGLHKGKGYRYPIIADNLKTTIGTTMQEYDINVFCRRYYQVIHRYVMESVRIIRTPAPVALTWVSLSDSDTWKSWLKTQKSTIIMASHYGNWEVVVPLLPALLDMPVVGFYKPISQKGVDAWVRENRGKFGLDLQPIEKTVRIMHARREVNTAYVFISDQTPVNLNGTYWNTFLGRSTPWLTGAEKLARKFSYPVVYLRQHPHETKPYSIPDNRTFMPQENPLYAATFLLLTNNPEHTAEGSITEAYTRLLEEEINTNPVWWLWSHKRWKRATQKP